MVKGISLGRVVGSKIRNSDEMPTDFSDWLEGDIFIHNLGERIPYYEYRNKELNFLGYLQGNSAVVTKLETGYFEFIVAQESGTFVDPENETITIDVVPGDFIVSSGDSAIEFMYDEESGNLYYQFGSTLKFIPKEEK